MKPRRTALRTPVRTPVRALAPDFKIVDRHVASHPVTRAVARVNLAAAVLDFQIHLHLLADGALVQSDGLASAKVLAVAIRACELQAQAEGPDCRVMRGGLEACVQLSARGWRWRTADANAIDTALQRAVQVYNCAPAQVQTAAWQYVTDLDRRTALQHTTPTPPPTPTTTPKEGSTHHAT